MLGFAVGPGAHPTMLVEGWGGSPTRTARYLTGVLETFPEVGQRLEKQQVFSVVPDGAHQTRFGQKNSGAAGQRTRAERRGTSSGRWALFHHSGEEPTPVMPGGAVSPHNRGVALVIAVFSCQKCPYSLLMIRTCSSVLHERGHVERSSIHPLPSRLFSTTGSHLVSQQ